MMRYAFTYIFIHVYNDLSNADDKVTGCLETIGLSLIVVIIHHEHDDACRDTECSK